jgi:hypothetical protein
VIFAVGCKLLSFPRIVVFAKTNLTPSPLLHHTPYVTAVRIFSARRVWPLRRTALGGAQRNRCSLRSLRAPLHTAAVRGTIHTSSPPSVPACNRKGGALLGPVSPDRHHTRLAVLLALPGADGTEPVAPACVPAVLAQADRMGVWPAVARRLAPSHPRLRRIAGRNILLRRYQRDLIAGLAQVGIRALPAKGVALVEALYPDLSWREVSDIDFLVAPCDVVKTFDALRNLGLRPNHPWTAAGLSRQIRRPSALAPELIFSGREGLIVEVHWNWPLPDLPESHVSANPEACLVYLCRHAGQHFWSCLKWCCDIELLVRRCRSELDWRRFWNLAASSGSVRSCAVSLLLCRAWFGGEPPPGLDAHLDRTTRRLARQVRAWVEHPDAPPPHPVWRQLRLAGWPDRFRMAAAWLAPRPQDCNAGPGLRVGWLVWKQRAAHLWRRWRPRAASLCASDWRVLAEAYAALARLLGCVRRPRAASAPPQPWPGERLRRLAWLVDAAADRQPVTVRCLTRSIALAWMLRRRGLNPDVRIGVRRREDRLEAHAWVECQGEVLSQPASWEGPFALILGNQPHP